jgi:hypothetical protein
VILTDTLLRPLLDLPPIASLLVLSLLSAAVLVLVIAGTSDQTRVRQTKRRIQAALFEVRLFNDDPFIVLRSVGDALSHNLTYLRLSLVPVAILAVPFGLGMTHLHPFYGYAGLDLGSAALLKVERRGSDGPRGEEQIWLDVPDAVRVEAGPVQLVGGQEVLWRLVPVTRGDFIVTIRVGEDVASKTLHVSNAVGRRSPARLRPGVVGQWLYPSEPPLDADGPFAAVTVTYPEAAIDVLGLAVHWVFVFLALTMGWALVLARGFGISL